MTRSPDSSVSPYLGVYNELSHSLEFTPERDAEFFAAIAAAAVFLLRADDPQAEPNVCRT